MKVLPFTIAVPYDRTIIVLDEVLPYFYTHLHRHEEVQLTWIINGEGTLIAGSNIHVFRSGDIYLLGSNMPHVFKSEPAYFEPDSGKQVHTITLFFNPYDKLGALFDLPEMKANRLLLQHFKSGFKLPDHLSAGVAQHISKINEAEGIDRLMQFLQLIKSLGGLGRVGPLTATVSYTTSDNEGMRIGGIYNYLLQNFDKPIALDDVASQANMTAHAFCRYFKKHTKHTFIGFLNKIRVNEACKMLLNQPDKGISIIAYSCGFSSITNFNRVFKSVTAKSPRAYMEKYNKSVEA